MSKITPAQLRKIHVLARERGLDSDTLHEYVNVVCGKKSLKNLTIMEAVRVIDSLEGKKTGTDGMMTSKQQKYIEGLAIELDWIDDSGKLDAERLQGFIKSRYNVDRAEWIDARTASKIIEGLKQMTERIKKKAV